MSQSRSRLPRGQDFIYNPMKDLNFVNDKGLCHGLSGSAIPLNILKKLRSQHPFSLFNMLNLINSMSKDELVKKYNKIHEKHFSLVNKIKNETLQQFGVTKEAELTADQAVEFKKISRLTIDKLTANLSELELQILYLQNIFSAIALIQDPKMNNNKQDIDLALSFIMPKEMETVGGLIQQTDCVDKIKNIEAEDCILFGAYHIDELKLYFEILAKYLNNADIKFKHPLSILIENIGHTILLGYNPEENNIWSYTNINHLNIPTLKQENIHKGVYLSFDFSFKEFSENDIDTDEKYLNYLKDNDIEPFSVIIATTFYAAGDDIQALQALIKNLKNDPEWIKINNIYNKDQSIDKAEVIDRSGNHLLMMAAYKKSFKRAQELIKYNDQLIDIKNKYNKSSLYFAVISGSSDIVKEILDNSSEHQHISNIKSYITLAIKYGYDKVLSEFINHTKLQLKYELNDFLLTSAKFILYKSVDGYNPCACMNLLIDNGADVNFTDSDNMTPLITAAKHGHTNAVELLLKNKANPNNVTKSEKNSALIFAVQGNHVTMVKLLLDHNADDKISDKDGSTPITIAIKKGYVEILDLLLNPSVNLKKCLFVVAQLGHLKAVELILAKGAKVDDEFEYCTALVIAAQNGHTEIVELLLRKGANPNFQSSKLPVTPLKQAVQNGHINVVKLLLHNKADPNLLSPIALAISHGQIEIIELLLKKAANEMINGKSLISYALHNREYSVLPKLLEHQFQNTKTNLPSHEIIIKHIDILICLLNENLISKNYLEQIPSLKSAELDKLAHLLILVDENPVFVNLIELGYIFDDLLNANQTSLSLNIKYVNQIKMIENLSKTQQDIIKHKLLACSEEKQIIELLKSLKKYTSEKNIVAYDKGIFSNKKIPSNDNTFAEPSKINKTGGCNIS